MNKLFGVERVCPSGFLFLWHHPYFAIHCETAWYVGVAWIAMAVQCGHFKGGSTGPCCSLSCIASRCSLQHRPISRSWQQAGGLINGVCRQNSGIDHHHAASQLTKYHPSTLADWASCIHVSYCVILTYICRLNLILASYAQSMA